MRALAATVLALATLFPGVPAGAEGEFDAARRRANELAGALADAQTRLAELEVEMAALEARAAAGVSRRKELEAVVRAQAVERFMRNTSPPLPLLEEDLNGLARANALARFVTLDTQAAVDEYRQAGEDLEATRQAIEVRQAETRAAVGEFRGRAEQVNAELERLQRLEEERRAREEAQRTAAEDERRAQEEAERRAADEARTAAREQGRPSPTPSRRSSEVASAAPPPPPTLRPATNTTRAAPAPAPAPTSSGGRAVASGGWLCPVQGPRAFSNDWGQPRSGGRRHQGNDILSPRGTPVVASVSGTVRPTSSSLGGLAYYLKGDDGNTYYGAHLASLSGASGRVAQGAVLGTVGNSGNAAGGPTHLHFEIQPGGGAPVNPYPTLARNC